ncbi:MAG: TOBE domain-containing protein, partial [Pseudomonadota bacterium]
TPLELYDHPINAFVATFIGAPSMNLLSARADGGRLHVGGLDLPGPEVSGPVTMGIRPEHLILDEAGLAMEVKVVEPTGSETMVFLTFEGQSVTAVFRERHAFQSGQVVHLRPDPDHIHIFDASSGMRL